MREGGLLEHKISPPSDCFYTLYSLGNGLFKCVRFNQSIQAVSTLPKIEKAEFLEYDHKLDNSISRARSRILELGLCNEWEWFCSFTVDPKKYDRYNLNKFYLDFTQFLRDQRKKGYSIKYLLVPERHKDGAWHLHGLMADLPPLVSFSKQLADGVNVPLDLATGNFYNWVDVSKKFGYCSLGRLNSPIKSAFYISKYMSKDNENLVTDKGQKLFRCSTGLNRKRKLGDHIMQNDRLDELLTHHYKFVSLGITKKDQNLDWSDILSFLDDPAEQIDPLDLGLDLSHVLRMVNYEQTSFF